MRHWPLNFIIPVASAVIAYVICLAIALKARAAARRSLALAHEMEEKLLAFNQDSAQLSQRLLDQADRLAQLEARPHSDHAQNHADFISNLTAPAKLSITERRHRVLSLARRGLDVETIATMLGAPYGEVELIIELNSATLGAIR